MAIAQSRQVAGLITERTGRLVEIVGVTTLGDVSRAQLTQIGGTGVFVSALREALLRGEVDLAMPRDVEPAAASMPGVVLIDMDQLSEHATAIRVDDVTAVRAILETELAGYQSAMDAARVAPTVVALRAKAAKVVDVELARLAGRLSADDLSGHALDEIAQTVRRVVDKLLHAPTVRVKELAGSPGGEEYAAALRVLFDLDPRAVEAVTRAAPEEVRS